MVEPGERFDRSVDRLIGIRIAGALLGVPLIVLVGVGAPQWASFAFLIAAVVILGTIAIKRRRSPSEKR